MRDGNIAAVATQPFGKPLGDNLNGGRSKVVVDELAETWVAQERGE